MVKETLAPVKPRTFIGPPADCCKPVQAAAENVQAIQAAPVNMAPVLPTANMQANMQANMPMNMPVYMPQSAPQGFGYQPMSVHAYYGHQYIQPQYRQQPYVQEYPVYANVNASTEQE
ncbi:hypothetical protein D3C75_976830 [compost metagenome]